MRFFPPLVRNHLVCMARIRALEGHELQEDDPIVVFISGYLLTLDEQYDEQASKLRMCIRRAEEAEKEIRRLQVEIAEAKAQATGAKSQEATAIEALKQAEDHHTQ